MKRLVKRGICLGLAGIMMAGLAACGNGQSGTDSAQSEAADSKNGGTAENAPLTIRFTWWGNQSRHEYTQKILDQYTKLHPNVKFEALPNGWDGYFDKLSTQAASGSMPDIVAMDYLYITTYAKNNSIADLQPYVDNGSIDISSISEDVLNTGKIDGKLAGIVGSTGSLAVGYNPEVFEKAGIELPNAGGDWSWDDFTAKAKELKEKTGKLGVTSTGVVDDTNLFNFWVRQHGAQLFSEDKKSLGYDDDQIMIDYLDMWKDLMDSGAAANPDEYAQIQTLGQEASPVVSGEAGMINENNNYASKLSGVNENLEITIPPVSRENPKAMWNKPGYFLCISESSKVKDEAVKFIDWFINSEESNEIMMAERGVPSSSKVREFLVNSGKMNEKQKEMFAYADTVLKYSSKAPAPDPVGIAEVGECFKNNANKAFYGQASSKEAAAAFRREANAILARNN